MLPERGGCLKSAREQGQKMGLPVAIFFWRPFPRSVRLILLNTKYQESIFSTYCYLQWKESCLSCPTG